MHTAFKFVSTNQYSAVAFSYVKNNLASVYVSFKKVIRGYYHFESSLLAEPGMHTKKGELTLLYKNKLEQTIKEDPANYLWSHRRFKYEYKEEYGGIIE